MKNIGEVNKKRQDISIMFCEQRKARKEGLVSWGPAGRTPGPDGSEPHALCGQHSSISGLRSSGCTDVSWETQPPNLEE